jgi:hypothetical protein
MVDIDSVFPFLDDPEPLAWLRRLDSWNPISAVAATKEDNGRPNIVCERRTKGICPKGTHQYYHDQRSLCLATTRLFGYRCVVAKQRPPGTDSFTAQVSKEIERKTPLEL